MMQIINHNLLEIDLIFSQEFFQINCSNSMVLFSPKYFMHKIHQHLNTKLWVNQQNIIENMTQLIDIYIFVYHLLANNFIVFSLKCFLCGLFMSLIFSSIAKTNIVEIQLQQQVDLFPYIFFFREMICNISSYFTHSESKIINKCNINSKIFPFQRLHQ